MDKLVGTIVLGLAIFLTSVVIGVAIALRIFFKRQEALKRGQACYLKGLCTQLCGIEKRQK